MTNKITRTVAGSLLRLMPRFAFPRLNAFLFRMQGYGVHPSARIFSTARILGDITVTIGESTFIGHEALIMGGESSITIGKNCDISSRVSIVSGTHETDMAGDRSAGKGIGKDIVIDDGVWIGFGALILPGVTIGRKAVIGAGSVVTRDIPPFTICAGNPCRPVKRWNPGTNSFDPPA